MRKTILTVSLALWLLAPAPAMADKGVALQQGGKQQASEESNWNQLKKQEGQQNDEAPNARPDGKPNQGASESNWEYEPAVDSAEDSDHDQHRDSDTEGNEAKSKGKADNGTGEERSSKRAESRLTPANINLLGTMLTICLLIAAVAALVMALQGMARNKRFSREIEGLRARLEEAEDQLKLLEQDNAKVLSAARDAARTAQQPQNPQTMRSFPGQSGNPAKPQEGHQGAKPEENRGYARQSQGMQSGYAAKPTSASGSAQAAAKPEPPKPKHKLYGKANAQGTTGLYKVGPMNPGDKVFMLELDGPDSTTASFGVIPNLSPEQVRGLAANKDTHLPASIVERNQTTQNPTRILTETQGEARKEGNEWVVVRPARIKLL